MRNRFVVPALALALLISLPAFAHHGAAVFETGKMVTLKGTVKSWVFSNPHCLLTLDVKGDNGAVSQWIAETQAPNVVYSDGYRKTSFKPGDVVTVTVQPVKNGRPLGRIVQAVLPDGTKLGSGRPPG